MGIAIERSPRAGFPIAGPHCDLWRAHELVRPGILAFITAMALFVVARRMSGLLVAPLPGVAVVALACVWSSIAFWLRSPLPDLRAAGRPGGWPAARHALVALLSIALAWSVSVEGTSAAGLVVLWLVVLSTEIAALARVLPLAVRRRQPLRRAARPADIIDDEPPELDFEPETTQWIVRRNTSPHGEMIEGTLRVPFERGQRSAAAHVAFCPPLAQSVACDAEQIDGPPATVRVAQLLAYGARFELKLDRVADDSGSVLLRFVAEDGPGRPAGEHP